MFSSNQNFVLTGDNLDENALKYALKLIIDGYEVIPRAIKYSEDGNMYLYEHKSTSAEEIDELEQNTEYLSQLIKLYLCSAKYKKAILNERKESFDGSYYEGWKMELTHEGFSNVIKISPFWCFYHK